MLLYSTLAHLHFSNNYNIYHYAVLAYHLQKLYNDFLAPIYMLLNLFLYKLSTDYYKQKTHHLLFLSPFLEYIPFLMHNIQRKYPLVILSHFLVSLSTLTDNNLKTLLFLFPLMLKVMRFL